MSIKKSFAILLIIATLTIGVCGCMDIVNGVVNSEKSETEEEDKAETTVPEPEVLSLEERMMNHLNERYDDTFTFDGWSPWGNHTRRNIFVTSEKFPREHINDKIMVEWSLREEGEYINDNYLDFVFREQAAAAIAEVLRQAIDSEFVFLYEQPYGVAYERLNPDITFDEFISNKNSRLSFTVVVAPGYDISDTESVENRIKDTFALHNVIIGNATICFSNNAEAFKALTPSGVSDYSSHNAEDPRLRFVNIGTEFERIYWSVGGN